MYLPFFRRLRYAALNYAANGALVFARMIPRSIGLALFGTIGSLAFSVPHPDRQRTLRNLTNVYGNRWDHAKIAQTARGVYRELSKNTFDAFILPHLNVRSFDRIVTHDPFDAVEKAYHNGKGCIMITAHTGCFEMLLHFFPKHGLKTFAIGKKLRDPHLDEIVRKTRSGNNIIYMDRTESPRKIVRYLQEGMLFGVLIDQDTAVEGVYADFLGKKAYTPSGPVKMAMKLDIPVFVVTSVRQPDNTHHVSIKGPVPLKQSGDFEKDLVDNVTTMNDIICSVIEAYPEQWVWMHRRWRTQPDAQQETQHA